MEPTARKHKERGARTDLKRTVRQTAPATWDRAALCKPDGSAVRQAVLDAASVCCVPTQPNPDRSARIFSTKAVWAEYQPRALLRASLADVPGSGRSSCYRCH